MPNSTRLTVLGEARLGCRGHRASQYKEHVCKHWVQPLGTKKPEGQQTMLIAAAKIRVYLLETPQNQDRMWIIADLAFEVLTEKFRVITDKAICWKVCADDLLFCPEPAFSSPFPSGDTGLCGGDRWASPGSLRGQRTVCKCSKHNPCDLPWAGHTHSWNLQLLHSRCQASFDTSESGFRCLFYL